MSKLTTEFNLDKLVGNLAALKQGREAITRAEERARNPSHAPNAPAHKVPSLGG